MRHTRTLVLGLTAGIAGSVLLTGCSTGTAPSGQVSTFSSSYNCAKPDNSSTETVTIAAQPIVSNGAIYAGIDQGFYKKHGLDLQVQPVANPAAAIASVQGGTSNFGFATTVSFLQSVDNGVPVSIVAPFAGIAPKYYENMKNGVAGYTTEITALVARPGSGINKPADLTGKTVAVADAQGQSELTTRYVIKQDGADPEAVKYTLMSFPDSLNAFKAGQVDAIFTVDPFLKQATEAGGKIISWPGVETFHEGPTSAMISSNQFISEHPETVTRFNCAMREAADYANKNHDVIRNVVAKQQNVAPSKLAAAVVPYFYPSTDIDGLKRFKDIMAGQGFLKTDINVESIVVPVALGTK